MSASTIAATVVNEPAVRVTRPLPELPDLGTCDCGLELVCLTDNSDVVFCEHCDLGLPLAGSRPARR
ncbi:hypothetical protein DI272_18975 [Streptomyces sp. Act143]|uniref:hypothetical protein n=1 Tax=Streptomyces sp. Act143 TaxID=2200760 RepID=UPI000D67BA68|nr:hypothetical protein [Streptomyces sp. Act143]PWI16017.1 hypothetical protein DI272_18975 [Streptomyces sp. Act143]